MPKLSAVIITKDEERDIGRTLDALSFADELVVVDSGSTDRTVDLCRGRGARVFERTFDGYGLQKRHAVARAEHDWVLCMDADEVVTPELAAAIRALVAGEPPHVRRYALRFHTVFMGRALSRGSPEAHVRLFDRRRARWSDAPVHERVEVDGPVGTLPGAVLHATARDLSEALQKLDAYTTRAARDLHARGRRRRLASIVVTSVFHFFKHWILRGQVLNGFPGLAWSMLFATGSAVKHLKVLQLDAVSPAHPALPEVFRPFPAGELSGGEPGR